MSTLLDKKIEYWEHQLLDLGKRNKMINYRETKRTTLKLQEPSFDELFRRLAIEEETLTFQRPVDRETDIRVFSILSLLEHLSSGLPVTIGDIRAEGSILERQKTLKNMRAKARLSLEEQGTNILYLSFGFIQWKDGKGASAQWIKSPLILVPAVLTLEALRSPYTLSKHEDDIVVNPTLQHYFNTEYGIELPAFDADKDTITGYLESLEEIADQRGWRILKEVSLGLLSFQKISMYNDLIRNEERIRNNPVIRAMAGDTAAVNDIPDELRTFDLDSIRTQDCYQVMSADSSQQDAILYSKNNISFVMQGPPGTGKSQTITNMIAEALANGKKVLFVSEKMAALQVVYQRLQEAHLADFCLPLHSYKANKKEILEQIGANLSLKQTRVKDAAIQSLEELLVLRQELNQYAAQLHQRNPELNISCYEVYSRLEEMREVPSLGFELASILDVTQAQLQVYLNKLQQYEQSLQRLDYRIEHNPWEGLKTRTTGFEYSEKMRQALRKVRENLMAILACLEDVEPCSQLRNIVTDESLPELLRSLRRFCETPAVPDQWLDSDNLSQLIAQAGEAKQHYENLFALECDIAGVFSGGIYDYDHHNWMSKLLAQAKGFVGMPFVDERSPIYYLENAKSLQRTFTDLRDGLSQANEAFAAMNGLLGTDLSVNAANQHRLTQLLSLIGNNQAIVKTWFSEDISKIRATIEEAKTKAARLLEIKQQLLSHWEEAVLSLDYGPILLRYKTEYTGFFKVFRSQYRQDKMRLQALSKTVIKKMTDELAVNLLLALKDYHEHEAWFAEHSRKLEAALGGFYDGVTSQWDAAMAALGTAAKIRALPACYLSHRLMDTLSADHAAFTATFAKFVDDANAAFGQIHRTVRDGGLTLDVYAADFSGATAVTTVDTYLELFARIEEQSRDIVPYLHEKETGIDITFQTLEKLNAHSNLAKTLASAKEEYRQTFGFCYDDRQTNWDGLIDLLHKLEELRKLPHYPELKAIINTNPEGKQSIQKLSDEISALHTATREVFDWVRTQFEPEHFATDMKLYIFAEKAEQCLDGFSMLDGWIDYQEAREDCCQNGLGSFIERAEAAKLLTDVERIFLKGFYHMWLGAVCDQSDSVRRFRRNAHDERIRKFVELDDLQLLIAQARIREKLIENLPSDHQLLRATDEVSILKKEMSKRRNIMPLRKLFKLIPNLLMKLKPCLMMSPLSVSYFLETEAYHFDLVIFDEASQIFPEDAIGAIFRGAQVIIAGDSKQLPPTNFFAATTNNAEAEFDLKEEEDFSEVVCDSILEETASVLPNRTLRWHYRSKHESLIAFSNRKIYQNSLITFPNSINNVSDMGVEYIYVEDGVYDRGGKANNIREARECVRLVFEHIDKHPDRSLGIIAFSESQQAAIENAIIDYRERNPACEWFFDETKDEPFFVKNLENVQGDERDTVIFSICYGKDKTGAMHMNFGPLGKSGGERRLNVAITRAKCNIKLVGSILPSDIDLSRAKTDGARLLRSYIEYAMKGTSVLGATVKERSRDTEDAFCQVIVSFLQNHGYKVETEVGCSDYKLDIAILNPNAEGEYIAGIECDGLSYVRAKTARDRDHLRRSVLQNMGWNLYRVWSTQWTRNPVAEGEALLNFLQSIMDQNGLVTHDVKSSNGASETVSLEQIASETEKGNQKRSADNPYGFAYYREANLWEAPVSEFSDYLTRIGEEIRYVVSVEQPIHLELLYKRLRPSFGTAKVTEAVRSTVDEAIRQRLSHQVKLDGDQFVRLVPETPAVARIPERDCAPRPMEHIHTEEVAAAMIRITRQSFGMAVEDLSTECARVFGFERRGPRIKRKTDAAVDLLVQTGKIRIIDGKVQLVNG